MMKTRENIIIIGGGLAGSLLSLYLVQAGYNVQVIEKRLKKQHKGEGRSINLALSTRGWQALASAGLAGKVEELAIAMYGRKVHAADEQVSFQPYGKKDQAIYSVDRNKLNLLLQQKAEEAGVHILFENTCKNINLENQEILTEDFKGRRHTIKGDVIIGADGAFSALRQAIKAHNREFHVREEELSYGYKEFTMPPLEHKKFALDPHALHIWPRQKFMLIALPNIDKSFTCTLFMPFDGAVSFSSLQMSEVFSAFFQGSFPDAYPLVQDLEAAWEQNPASSLYTIQCYPWAWGKNLLIGDAAHAMVPFYGQGMNAAFEDCRIFKDLLAKDFKDWPDLFQHFQELRKPNADAIASLALENFTEMRDHVAKPQFLLRKKIDRYLHEQFPETWMPLYTMVTFTNIPYAEAYALGKKQENILDEIMAVPGIEKKWQNMNLQPFIEKIHQPE